MLIFCYLFCKNASACYFSSTDFAENTSNATTCRTNGSVVGFKTTSWRLTKHCLQSLGMPNVCSGGTKKKAY